MVDAGRILPADYLAEQTMLGSMLVLGNDIAYSECVSLGITRESFHWDKHKLVWDAIAACSRENSPVDLVAVSSQLRSMNKLDEIGGDYYLSELSLQTPFPQNYAFYASIVLERQAERKLIEIGTSLSFQIQEPGADSRSCIQWAHEQIIDVHTRLDHKKTWVSVGDAIKGRATQLLEYQRTGTNEELIPTGISDLDRIILGMGKGELVVLGARPSMGKTALAVKIASENARNGRSVGILSLEMTKDQLSERLLAMVARIPLYKLRAARFSNAQRDDILKAQAKMLDWKIFIDDEVGDRDALSIFTRANLLHKTHGLDVLIIDHLHLMARPKHTQGDTEATSENSRQMKVLAKRLGIPLLLLAQLNRETEKRPIKDRRPRPSDFRSSGAVEQDADVLLAMFRESYYEAERRREANESMADLDFTTELIVLKSRQGIIGTCSLRFEPEYMDFLPLTDRTPPPSLESYYEKEHPNEAIDAWEPPF